MLRKLLHSNSLNFYIFIHLMVYHQMCLFEYMHFPEERTMRGSVIQKLNHETLIYKYKKLGQLNKS